MQSGGPALSAPEAVRGAVALGNPAPARGSLEAPVSGDISSGFGWRADPFTGRRSWHAGVDIKAEPGEAVRAARGGVVSFAGEHPELGNLVVVEHGDGLRTFYGITVPSKCGQDRPSVQARNLQGQGRAAALPARMSILKFAGATWP